MFFSKKCPIKSNNMNSTITRFCFDRTMPCILLLLIVILSCSSNNNRSCFAKEIEAKREWTLLGENDTIPAGLHVRIDMTTGEKWVKLMDDDDDEENDAEISQDDSIDATKKKVKTTTTTTTTALIEADGTIQNGNKKNNNDEVEYNFEMMHRVLSYLPDDEKERIGLPPKLLVSNDAIDDNNNNNDLKNDDNVEIVSPEERLQFEQLMTKLWEQRQKELKDLEENTVLDLPEVLKERMKSIENYLKDPMKHFNQMIITNDGDIELDIPDEDDEEEDNTVTHIISVLEDLEFQLTDVDMTRDFHTLGGWGLIVALLADEVHMARIPELLLSSTTDNKAVTTDLKEELMSKIRYIQTYAAWTIGTAIKNTGEFFPYAIEKVTINFVVVSKNKKQNNNAKNSTTNSITNNDNSAIKQINAIDLLIDLFVKQYDDDNSNKNKEESIKIIQKLRAKAIYAIGALLRGNRIAQNHICNSDSKDDGPYQLGNFLHQMIESNNVFTSSQNNKLVQRLLTLASDIIVDIQLHGESTEEDAEEDDNSNNNMNDIIIKKFTSSEWCDSTIDILKQTSTTTKKIPMQFQEVLLQTIDIFAPYCRSSSSWKEKSKLKDAIKSIHELQKEWEMKKDDFDLDHYNQLLNLATTATTALKGGK